MNAATSLAAVIAATLSCACGRNGVLQNNGEVPAPSDPIELPWPDYPRTTLAPGESRTEEIHSGSYVYNAHYGADTAGGQVTPVVTDAGLNWRQSSGYFYLWGHWLLFETERTRTITWGTAVAARMLPASGNLPEREQIIIRCGRVLIMPRTPTPTTFAPLMLEAGDDGGVPIPMYVIVTTVSQGQSDVVTISEPAPLPRTATEPNPDGILEFYRNIVHPLPGCEE
jgi:hypothetical protein